MISDVLWEAAEQIRQYQAQSPEAYGKIEPQIDFVVEQMRKLQLALDLPPGDKTSDKLLGELRPDFVKPAGDFVKVTRLS